MPERIITPGREILSDLSEKWLTDPVDPAEAFLDVKHEFDECQLKYSGYVGTALSTGGFRRDTSLSLKQAITSNRLITLDAVDELHYSGHKVEDFIESAALDQIPGWEQSDYIKFWLMAMSSPVFDTKSPNLLREFSRFNHAIDRELRQAVEYDHEVMNNPSASNEERARHHELHMQAFHKVVSRLEVHPIDELIQLFDHERSLGQRVEARFARILGARVYEVAVAERGLPDNPELDAKINRLRELGVTIPVSRASGLTVVEQRTNREI